MADHELHALDLDGTRHWSDQVVNGEGKGSGAAVIAAIYAANA